MFSKLISEVKCMNKSIKSTMFNGFKISFVVCLFSILILNLYTTYPVCCITYDVGLILFKTSILFAVCFFMSAYITNSIFFN